MPDRGPLKADARSAAQTAKERAVVDAVLYAMRVGCFFPVPAPKPPYRIPDLIQWGAMRNLHTKVAELTRGNHP